MESKAIAVHAIFLVAVIMIFLFFVTVTFFGWIDWSGKEASKFSCTAKLHSYCSDWKKTDFTKTPWDWYTKGPEGCERKEIGITKPDRDKCEEVLGIG